MFYPIAWIYKQIIKSCFSDISLCMHILFYIEYNHSDMHDMIIYSTPNIFNNCFSSSQLPYKTLSLGRTLSLNILQLVDNRINVQGNLMFIKETISNIDCTVTRFRKINIRNLLVNYLNIVKKHVFNMPNFAFTL
jgi:hypothetical protein